MSHSETIQQFFKDLEHIDFKAVAGFSEA
jgi:hypothetical protein